MPSKKRSRANNFRNRKSANTQRVCGWYECEECGTQWVSAFTRILRSTGEANEPQICGKCEHDVFPYKIVQVTRKNEADVLERAYGEFKCEGCGSHWSSTEVWIVRGTLVAWYPETCRCGLAVWPYLVLKVGRKELERAYGHFECDEVECGNRWTSAFTWRVRGTKAAWYWQACLECGNEMYPYRMETILCQTCQRKPCVCDRSEAEEQEPDKPHIQRLCEACKNEPMPCSKFAPSGLGRRRRPSKDDGDHNNENGNDNFEDAQEYLDDGQYAPDAHDFDDGDNDKENQWNDDGYYIDDEDAYDDWD